MAQRDDRAYNRAALNERLIAHRYRVEERVGGGAFGEVFKGHDIKTGRLVAFKMELNRENVNAHLQLEYKIYRRFNECSVTVGIPRVYHCGTAGEYTIMVMDLLGPSLEDLFCLCHRRFSVKTVCMLGLQIIERLQYIHSCGYLHRDIKPENFVMGIGSRSHVVYVIDVGLAKAWRDKNGKHIERSEGKALTGTARYVSINTHNGIQQSRRDDLESVTYLLMYFLRGSLPWQGLRSPKSDVHYTRICEVKLNTSPEALAEGFPPEYGKLVEYARSLEFTQEPNYNYCTQLIFEAMGNADIDYFYEWNLKAVQAEDNFDQDSTTDTDRRRNSRHSTAVAMEGDASNLAEAEEGADALDPSSAPVFSQNLLSVNSASYGNFLDDMHDTFGIGEYY